MGMFATGQAYEQLLMHLFASPLPEAREYGRMILAELKKTMPSFVARVDNPERGGRWIHYLEEREQAADRWAGAAGARPRPARGGHAPVGQAGVGAGQRGRPAGGAAVRGRGRFRGGGALRRARAAPDERATLLGELVGERENRRHRPGRGFEALRYRFEVVGDYGAFRDLQRHRMLTVQWQPLTPYLGAGVPEELEEAGVADAYSAGLERSHAEYERLVDCGAPRRWRRTRSASVTGFATCST